MQTYGSPDDEAPPGVSAAAREGKRAVDRRLEGLGDRREGFGDG